MLKKVASFLVSAVILCGGLFSAYNNFLLFRSILGEDLSGLVWSLAGLALFDVGALGWLMYFAHGARGNAQRATAALAGVACLVLTLIAASTHLLIAQTLVSVPAWAGQVVIGSIVLALVINLVAATANHMTHPDTLRAMREQAIEDERREAIERAQQSVFREALRQAEAKVASQASAVSEKLSAEFATDAVRDMLAMTANGANTPVSTNGHTPAHAFAAEAEAPAPKLKAAKPQ